MLVQRFANANNCFALFVLLTICLPKLGQKNVSQAATFETNYMITMFHLPNSDCKGCVTLIKLFPFNEIFFGEKILSNILDLKR